MTTNALPDHRGVARAVALLVPFALFLAIGGASGGLLTVVLDREWQHESPSIVGLTAAELQSAARFEPAR